MAPALVLSYFTLINERFCFRTKSTLLTVSLADGKLIFLRAVIVCINPRWNGSIYTKCEDLHLGLRQLCIVVMRHSSNAGIHEYVKRICLLTSKETMKSFKSHQIGYVCSSNPRACHCSV